MIPRDRVLEKLDSFLRSNDTAGAKRLLSYWLSEAEFNRDDHGILLMQNELMGHCRKLGEKEEALKYAQAALDQVGKMGIEENVGGATTFLNSATVCKAFDLPEDAINLYQMAREVYERELESDDQRLAGLYNNLGLALVDVKKYDEARELYRKALTVLNRSEHTESEQAITYLNLATCEETEHGLDKARPLITALAQKAKECMELGKDRTDGDYAFVCEKCASVFGFYGEEDYARELLGRSRRIYEGT